MKINFGCEKENNFLQKLTSENSGNRQELVPKDHNSIFWVLIYKI